MSKTVKSVLVIAAAVAIVVFAPAIGSALVGAGLSLGSATLVAAAGYIAQGLAAVAISAALAAASSLLLPVPKASNSLAERLSLNPDTTAPRKIVFGRTAAGQDLRFKQTWGNDKDRVSYVVANASHRLSGVQAIYLDSELSHTGGALTGKYAPGILELSTCLEGTPTNGRAVGSGAFWNASSTFLGCAYTVMTFRTDKAKVFPQGLPSRVTTIVDGCPVYDPRRDSTRGGSGPHRINDQSTWAFTAGGVEIGRNPALCLLTYLIGWRIAGKLAWGWGLPAEKIDLASFIFYANLCEERVALNAGGTVQRYLCDGIQSTADSHETVTNSICACMGSAVLVDVGGLFTLIGGYDDSLATPFAFNDDDLLGEDSWNPSPPSRERFNIIKGRYADPGALYTLADWGRIEVDPMFDQIPRTLGIDYGLISSAEACQRISKQRLYAEKWGGTFTGVFGPRAFAVQVGSIVTLSHSRHGWNNKRFRVIDQSEAHDLIFQMTLREDDSEIYAWDKAEFTPPPANLLNEQYDPATAELLTGLSLSTMTATGANGVTTSFVRVSWTRSTSARVSEVEIATKLSTSDAWTEVGGRIENVGFHAFSAEVGGAAINVRARYVMDNGVRGAWTYADVTTATNNLNSWGGIWGPDKAADNATRNDDGANMIPAPVTLDQCVFANGGSFREVLGGSRGRPADSIRVLLQGTTANNLAQAYWCGPYDIPCGPNETLYYEHAVGGDLSLADGCRAGYVCYRADGSPSAYATGGAFDMPLTARQMSAVFGGFSIAREALVTSPDAAFIRPYVIRNQWTPGIGGTFFVSEPYLGRAEKGSTFGAPNGSPVGGVEASRLVADLYNIASDNVVTAGTEKRELYRIYITLRDQYIGVYNQSASMAAKYGADYTAGTRNEMGYRWQLVDSQITSTPGWDNASVDSSIDGALLNQRVINYQKAVANCLEDMQNCVMQSIVDVSQVATDAEAAAQVGVLLDDAVGDNNKLSKAEKKRILAQVNGIVANIDGQVQRLAALGLSAEAYELGQAWSDLHQFLIAANYTNTKVNTPMNGDLYHAKNTRYANAQAAAANAARNMAQNLTPDGRQKNALLASGFLTWGSTQTTVPVFTRTSSSIGISDFTMDVGDGPFTVTGATIGGLAPQTYYYIWLLLPNMNNSSRSFSLSTNYFGNSDRQRFYIGGQFTLTSAGTDPGGGGGGGGGGTGGFNCVSVDALLLDDLRAGDARAGSPIEVLVTGGQPFVGAVHSNEEAVVECVRLTTAGGATLTLAAATPIDLMDGTGWCRAQQALNMEVLTIRHGTHLVDRVIDVEPLGLGCVAHISVGGHSYAAGDQPGHRIFTHNPAKP